MYKEIIVRNFRKAHTGVYVYSLELVGADDARDFITYYYEPVGRTAWPKSTLGCNSNIDTRHQIDEAVREHAAQTIHGGNVTLLKTVLASLVVTDNDLISASDILLTLNLSSNRTLAHILTVEESTALSEIHGFVIQAHNRLGRLADRFRERVTEAEAKVKEAHGEKA